MSIEQLDSQCILAMDPNNIWDDVLGARTAFGLADYWAMLQFSSE